MQFIFAPTPAERSILMTLRRNPGISGRESLLLSGFPSNFYHLLDRLVVKKLVIKSINWVQNKTRRGKHKIVSYYLSPDGITALRLSRTKKPTRAIIYIMLQKEKIIKFIKKRGRPTYAYEIARETGIERHSLSNALMRMIADGSIEYCDPPEGETSGGPARKWVRLR